MIGAKFHVLVTSSELIASAGDMLTGIGAQIDKGDWDNPDWSKLLHGYQPMQRWLAERRPDAAILVYNDHVTTFFENVLPLT